ncbi:hypothetical protein [Arthrobacter cryoconiti]|uniref:Uncharacterized protein n=1 Tax=Arthrobacter cryoconiti TaxID=748907 RepID=A0ABV8R6Y4_9MICC|nr:hypothetical protein [Arthrobacter cryoconiti]MCC9069428.1 hypothetical protein [Arthrobacter cryoconiti]
MNLAQSPFRFPRAAVLAATVLGMQAAAHQLTGDQLPPTAILATLACVAFLPPVLLARVKMTALVLIVYLAAGQTVLHYVFAALAGGSSHVAQNTDHRGTMTVPAAKASLEAFPQEHLTAPGSLLMLTWHTVATVFAAMMLAWGEFILWTLSRWLRHRISPPQSLPIAFGQHIVCTGYRSPVKGCLRQGHPSPRGPPGHGKLIST